LESAPGPPWSAVEHASTHPHEKKLRRARHDGNEVISQCGRPTECVPGGGGPQGTLLDNRRTASDRTLDRDCCPTWSRSAISEGKRCAPCNRATSSFSSAIMRSTAARLRRITWPGGRRLSASSSRSSAARRRCPSRRVRGKGVGRELDALVPLLATYPPTVCAHSARFGERQ
jgi:hypothetical protein